MRSGDWLLLFVIAASAAGIGVDAMTGGAFGVWLRQMLPGYAQAAGQGLGWIAMTLTPVMFAPLAAGLWGRFAGLPDWSDAFLRRLSGVIDRISVTIGDMARWAALALVVITAIIVIQRYVFGVSITRLQESVIYLHSALFLLSSAAALLQGGHVRVDIIYSKLDERGRAWTDLAGVYLALIPMCWLILETSRSYVGGAWRVLERSRESDGLPLVFLLKTAIPVFAIMMILQGISMAARAALTLSGRRAPESGASEAPADL